VHADIDLEDRVTYAQAEKISGMSRSYLVRHIRRGELRRISGGPCNTWLWRVEMEELALRMHRWNRQTDYWVTMTEAARILNLHRTSVYAARDRGRFPARVKSGVVV